MPRDRVTIERFNAGMITAITKEDLPLDVAVLAQDVDNSAQEGILRGRYGDSTYSASMGKNALAHGWIVKDDDTRDLVYYNAGTGEIRIITDFYGTTPVESTLHAQAVNITPAVAGLGKSLRMGLGNEADRRPKWIGIIPEGQFGVPESTGVQIADAELVIPGSVPFLEKVIFWNSSGTDYVIGFNETEATRLFKINLTTNAVTTSNTSNDFTNIKAICDSGTGKMWVYALDSTYGTLYQVDKATLELVANGTHGLNEHTVPAGMYFSDMVETNAMLWFAVYNPTTTELNETCLYNVLLTDCEPGDGNITLTNRSPRTIASGTAAGAWVNFNGSQAAAAPIIKTYKRSLMKVSTTEVAWLNSRVASGGAVVYVRTSTGLTIDWLLGSCFNIIADGQTAGAVTKLVKIHNYDALRAWNGLVGKIIVNDVDVWQTYGTTLARTAILGVDTIDPAVSPYPATAGATLMNSAVQLNTAPNDITFTAINSSTLYGFRQSISPVLYSCVGYGDTTMGPVISEYEGGEIELTVTNGTPETFSTDTKYFYRLSLGYDGFQVSPLSIAVATSTNTTTGYSKQVDITIPDITLLSPRVTSVQVWRAQAAGTIATAPEGFYRLVADIKLTSPRWVITGDTAVYNNHVDDEEAAGASYEAHTGLSEVLESSMPHYSLAAELNSYLFVGKCYHAQLPDADHIIFRSKPGRFDMFDWSTDIVRLPIVPTALAAWGGRLFAFSETATYRINPEAMVIEDVMEGVGVKGSAGIYQTEYGLLVVNKTNIHLFTQQGIQLIGEPIRSGENGWSTMSHGNYDPIAMYSPELQSLIIMCNSTGTTDVLWVYHIGRKRWDLWTLGTSATKPVYAGMFAGKLGEIYVSRNTGLFRIAHDTQTRKFFTWTSRRFYFDAPGQYKKLYKVVPNKNSGTLTLTMDKDNATTFAVSITSPYALSNTNWRLLSAQFKIVSTAAAAEVYALDIIYRLMVGVR